ncbi:hypothetical protein WDW86_16110 [Bdellovibrionota bacterium FG-2]
MSVTREFRAGLNGVLDTVLLLALPASGKSEVRRYLAKLNPAECQKDFHMGPTVQLDDFPYVHLMRQTDEALVRFGQSRFFFHSGERPFQDAKNWGTLIELLNEDYMDLLDKKTVSPKSSADWLLRRFDAAAKTVGAKGALSVCEGQHYTAICDALEAESSELKNARNELNQQDLTGKTIVIEAARGGAADSAFPLPEPFGYQYSIAKFSPEILKRASILYIWVTPEESRRKNQERTNPNDPGSILHHGVPIEVMLNDYGCDDMNWLEEKSTRKGYIQIKAQGKEYDLPIARFDNRVDKTSFIRKEKQDWAAQEVKAVHDGLCGALTQLLQMK